MFYAMPSTTASGALAPRSFGGIVFSGSAAQGFALSQETVYVMLRGWCNPVGERSGNDHKIGFDDAVATAAMACFLPKLLRIASYVFCGNQNRHSVTKVMVSVVFLCVFVIVFSFIVVLVLSAAILSQPAALNAPSRVCTNVPFTWPPQNQFVFAVSSSSSSSSSRV